MCTADLPPVPYMDGGVRKDIEELLHILFDKATLDPLVELTLGGAPDAWRYLIQYLGFHLLVSLDGSSLPKGLSTAVTV